MRSALWRLTGVACLGLLGCLGCQSESTSSPTNSIQVARTGIEGKRFDDALRAAEAYLRENPGGTETAKAHYFRGRALEGRAKPNGERANTDYREAKKVYEQALSANPDAELRSYVLTSLGNVEYWLGDYASAEQRWTGAYGTLANEDLKAWVLYRIGLCQQRQGKFPAADQTFAEVQKTYPNNEAADRARDRSGAKGFFVQVGAFSTAASAEQVVAALKKKGLPAQRMLKTDRNLQVAMVGPMRTYAEAIEMKKRLGGEYADSVIVP